MEYSRPRLRPASLTTCTRSLGHGSPGSLADRLWQQAAALLGHPSGWPCCVDKLAEIFQLPTEALASTREVLRRYGNMSSATILFVLDTRQQLRAEALAGSATQTAPKVAWPWPSALGW